MVYDRNIYNIYEIRLEKDNELLSTLVFKDIKEAKEVFRDIVNLNLNKFNGKVMLYVESYDERSYRIGCTLILSERITIPPVEDKPILKVK